jgi:hypothetical protein
MGEESGEGTLWDETPFVVVEDRNIVLETLKTALNGGGGRRT